MERKGLCTTCIEAKACIFVKEPPVLQCEEFSHGNHTPAKFKQAKTKKPISCEVATESE
jgi:hypothetical protein